MSGFAESTGFVPSVAGGQHMQHIKLQLTDGACSQRMMACVRRIKSATIQTYEPLAGIVQIQALGLRKSV